MITNANKNIQSKYIRIVYETYACLKMLIKFRELLKTEAMNQNIV